MSPAEASPELDHPMLSSLSLQTHTQTDTWHRGGHKGLEEAPGKSSEQDRPDRLLKSCGSSWDDAQSETLHKASPGGDGISYLMRVFWVDHLIVDIGHYLQGPTEGGHGLPAGDKGLLFSRVKAPARSRQGVTGLRCLAQPTERISQPAQGVS